MCKLIPLLENFFEMKIEHLCIEGLSFKVFPVLDYTVIVGEVHLYLTPKGREKVEIVAKIERLEEENKTKATINVKSKDKELEKLIKEKIENRSVEFLSVIEELDEEIDYLPINEWQEFLFPIDKSLKLLNESILKFPYELKFTGNDNLSEREEIIGRYVIVKDFIKSDIPFVVEGWIELDRREPIAIWGTFLIKLDDEFVIGGNDTKVIRMDYNLEKKEWGKPYLDFL